MKTITVNGKVYQVGAVYWAYGEYLELVGHNTSGGFIMAYPDKTSSYISAKKIGAAVGKVGTIEDAPLEVKAGEVWMCHYEVQTGSESCEHFTLPFVAGLHGSFHGVPANALLFTPKYKLVKAES